MEMVSKVEIYETTESQVNVEVQFEGDTVWLSQSQMSELFDQTKQNISLHISNCFNEGELNTASTVKESLTVQKEGNRQVKRNTKYYNLDVIISVGYRVKSKNGTKFRIWATNRLKELLITGYAINQKRLEQKEQEVIHLKNGIKILSRVIKNKTNQENNDWLNTYALGLRLLDDYDHEALDIKGISEIETSYPDMNQYEAIVNHMRKEFNSDVFGKEKDGGFKSAIEQIKKGFNNSDFYPTIEQKAANLLYLIIKNHAFVDGNKRIGAACFLLFLKENNILTNSDKSLLISNEALASITLFVASSKADEKESVVKLIVSVLNRNQQ